MQESTFFNFLYFFHFSHDKALEAMTMKGEAENKTRFHAVITALKGDNYPATLKVSFLFLTLVFLS